MEPTGTTRGCNTRGYTTDDSQCYHELYLSLDTSHDAVGQIWKIYICSILWRGHGRGRDRILLNYPELFSWTTPFHRCPTRQILKKNCCVLWGFSGLPWADNFEKLPRVVLLDHTFLSRPHMTNFIFLFFGGFRVFSGTSFGQFFNISSTLPGS